MSMLHLHLAASLLALGAVAAALAVPKGRGAHRRLGRLATAGLVVSALSSFWLPALGRLSWIHVLSVVTLVNVALAVRAARQGRIAAHRAAMLSSVGGLVVAGIFAVAAPGRTLHALLLG